MKVLKFGGTSVGNVENIIQVKNIIQNDEKKIVVLSAMSGTTNSLIAITSKIKENDRQGAFEIINYLYSHYNDTLNNLMTPSSLKQEARSYIDKLFTELKKEVNSTYSNFLFNKIISKGELLSTFIFTKYLQQEGINVCLLPALNFMRVDVNGEPDYFYIKQNLTRIINETLPTDIYVTQGFICLDSLGDNSNLQRGGSDYTATIIGSVVNAEEVQIWTDIDGLHNNDPRFVEDTHAISNISFEEAAELAYFGAKILHPKTVTPAKEANIPVRLKNTMNPEAYGTLIKEEATGEGIKAIAAKDGITALKIKSANMLLAFGFLKKIFEIFEKYETPIDMITTSEIAVSLTIDDTSSLTNILEELKKFALVEVDTNQSIVCLVGHSIVHHHETYRLFQILHDVSIRMISYGGSNNNISLLINSDDKVKTLKNLNNYIFELEKV